MRTNEWSRTLAIVAWSVGAVSPLAIVSRAWAGPSLDVAAAPAEAADGGVPGALTPAAPPNPNGGAVQICADCRAQGLAEGTPLAPETLARLRASVAEAAQAVNPLVRIQKPLTLEARLQEMQPQFPVMPVGPDGSNFSFQWNPVTQLPAIPLQFDASIKLSEARYTPPQTTVPAPPVVAAPPAAEAPALAPAVASLPAPAVSVDVAGVKEAPKLKIWTNVPLAPAAAPPVEEAPTQYSISTIGPDAQPLVVPLP